MSPSGWVLDSPPPTAGSSCSDARLPLPVPTARVCQWVERRGAAFSVRGEGWGNPLQEVPGCHQPCAVTAGKHRDSSHVASERVASPPGGGVAAFTLHAPSPGQDRAGCRPRHAWGGHGLGADCPPA